MTNSTDKDEKKKKNKNKKKGPIRFEAIIPVIIVFVGIGIYISIFFDSHLKIGLEWTATQVHGAEVNIGSIHTSFFGASFALHDLEITDKDEPTQNLVQIGKIRFQMLWDALLRAKIVVQDATIENIQAYVPRSSPGRVIPPGEGGGGLQKVEDSVMSQTREDFNQNVIGDLAEIVGGADPSSQMKNIEGELKANARIQEVEKSLNEKQKAWDKRLKELPKDSEIKKVEARIKKLKFNTKNPKAFAESLKEAKVILSDVNSKIKNVKNTSKDLKGDLKEFNGSIAEIDKLVKQDLKDLENRLKIPSLDVESFSKGLFGKLFQQKLAGLKKYMKIGREYMPPEKDPTAPGGKEEIVPRKRGAGKNYRFPITTGYPLFWLKHAAISSEPTDSEYSGRIAGKITDLTTDPTYIKKPFIADLEGDFPKQQIQGFKAKLTVDHTTNEPEESLVASVASYPVGGKSLSNSDDVTFKILKASGASKINAKLKNQSLDIKVKNWFKKIDYMIDAKSAIVKEILTGVAKDVPVVSVDASAMGEWDSLKWKISSNIGDELSKGFKKQIEAKISGAKKKIEKMVNEKIGSKKDKLTKQFNSAKSKIDSVIKGKEKQISKAKNQIDSKKKKGGSNSLKDKGKKAVDDLKKSLGF